MRFYDNEPENQEENNIVDSEVVSEENIGPRKMTFGEQFINSITKPKSIIEMIQNKTGSFVKYYILLCMLIAFMTFGIPVIATTAGFGGYKNLFLNEFPKFEVKDGAIVAEEKYSINISGLNLYMDPTVDIVDVNSLSDNAVWFVFGRKEIALYVIESGQALNVMQAKVGDVFPDGVNNSTLAQTAPIIYITFVIYYVFVAIGFMIRYALLAFIYMIIASSYNRLSGLRLSGGEVYKMCIYAQTIGILLVNINAAFGYILPPFIISMVGIFITYSVIGKTYRAYIRPESED